MSTYDVEAAESRRHSRSSLAAGSATYSSGRVLLLFKLYCLSSLVRNEALFHNVGLNILYAITLIVYIILFFSHSSLFLKNLKYFELAAKFWVVVCIYFAVSVLWSGLGGVGLVKAPAIILLVVAAYGFSASLGIKLFEGLYTSLAIVTIIGALLSVLLPDLCQEQVYRHLGDWRGLAGQKNSFGFQAALLSVISIYYWWKSGKLISFHAIILVFGLISLYFSGSRGGQLSLAVGLTVLIILFLPMAFRRILLLFGIVLLPIVLIALFSNLTIHNQQVVIFGYEIDTAGRLAIWSYVMGNTPNLFLGAGLEGFWTQARQWDYWRLHGWFVPNFHNGYITTFAEGGLIGAALAALFLAFLIASTMRSTMEQKAFYNALPIVMVCIFMVRNLTEDSFIRSTDVFTMAMGVSLFLLNPPLRSRS